MHITAVNMIVVHTLVTKLVFARLYLSANTTNKTIQSHWLRMWWNIWFTAKWPLFS